MEIMKFFFHKITVTGELTVAAIIFRICFSLYWRNSWSRKRNKK